MNINYNISETLDIPSIQLYKFIKSILEQISSNPNSYLINCTINNSKLIINEISNGLAQIKSNNLIYNKNWGIDPVKCYAIPYMNKDTPLEKSIFTSNIISIFLTLYHYIIIEKYNVDLTLTNFIINNNLISKIFNIDDDTNNITPEKINNLIKLDKSIFNNILDEIFNRMFELKEENLIFI